MKNITLKNINENLITCDNNNIFIKLTNDLKSLKILIDAKLWNAVENFDTSNITDMNNLFRCVKGIESLDLSKWNVSNVKDNKQMFGTSQIII